MDDIKRLLNDFLMCQFGYNGNLVLHGHRSIVWLSAGTCRANLSDWPTVSSNFSIHLSIQSSLRNTAPAVSRVTIGS